ncbi:MAG: ArdC family protein [Bradyrhizobium sp.]|uniref:ArdC family protein n=1 Tax=Bradyrhizobium sp. TaxID=376 RepID=UPI003D0C15C4
MGSQADLYQSVTDRIIAALESGTAPWVRPWKNDRSGGNIPHNAVSRRGYHGINVALLWMQEAAMGYSSPSWLTFKQAADAGGNVRKGEKGTQIVFWQFRQVKDSATGDVRTVPMLRTYYVFNVAQCEDITLPSPRKAAAPIPPTDIDAIVAKTGATIRHGGDRAFYTTRDDSINMPNRAAFNSIADYHGTLLHELTHWTSHGSRCNRELGKRFGDEAYAAEELIAEMGSAFLCGALNVPHENLQHANYMASWLRVLKADNRAILPQRSRRRLRVTSS